MKAGLDVIATNKVCKNPRQIVYLRKYVFELWTLDKYMNMYIWYLVVVHKMLISLAIFVMDMSCLNYNIQFCFIAIEEQSSLKAVET